MLKAVAKMIAALEQNVLELSTVDQVSKKLGTQHQKVYFIFTLSHSF